MSKPITRSKPGQLRHADHADDPAGRPGQDRVLAPEVPGLASPPLDCMNISRMPAQFGGDLVDVAAQDRREIGVDDGGVAARHQLHQRAHLVRAADLGEADARGPRAPTARSCAGCR